LEAQFAVFSCAEEGEAFVMSPKCHVVIVEDHAIIREGLRSLFSSSKEFEVVGEAEDGREAITCIEELKPDLVLTDLSMPKMDGMDMIETIKKKSPDTKVIALTVHRTEEYVVATLKAGADGYVLKEADYAELMMAVKKVLKGKHYLSPEISGKLIDGYLDGRRSAKIESVWEILTRREREILKLIAEGHKNKEIAKQLYISVNTVEKHRSNIMDKLNLHSTAALLAFAMEKGLVVKE
jgi:two-component system response regulator NreC